MWNNLPLVGWLSFLTVISLLLDSRYHFNTVADATNTFHSTGPSGIPAIPCPLAFPCQCTELRILCEDSQYTSVTFNKNAPFRHWFEMRLSLPRLREFPSPPSNMSIRVEMISVTSSNLSRLKPRLFMPFVKMSRLNLSGNMLDELDNGDLFGLDHLESLDLHRNKIHTIHPDTFNSLPRLRQLFLSYNFLTVVPKALVQLPRLSHLYLRGNPIHRLPAFSFRGLSHLVILDLSQLSKPLRIDRRAFCGIQKITQVGDSQESYISIQGLTRLYLQRNLISQLEPCTLKPLVLNLRHLYLESSVVPCSPCNTLENLRVLIQSPYCKYNDHPEPDRCITDCDDMCSSAETLPFWCISLTGWILLVLNFPLDFI